MFTGVSERINPFPTKHLCKHQFDNRLSQADKQKNQNLSKKFGALTGSDFYWLSKNATTMAPGPTWVPMVAPTVEMGSVSTLPSHSWRLSAM